MTSEVEIKKRNKYMSVINDLKARREGFVHEIRQIEDKAEIDVQKRKRMLLLKGASLSFIPEPSKDFNQDSSPAVKLGQNNKNLRPSAKHLIEDPHAYGSGRKISS